MNKYIKLLKDSSFNPVVLIVALATDGFKLAMKTPQWVITMALIIIFGGIIAVGLNFVLGF